MGHTGRSVRRRPGECVGAPPPPPPSSKIQSRRATGVWGVGIRQRWRVGRRWQMGCGRYTTVVVVMRGQCVVFKRRCR